MIFGGISAMILRNARSYFPARARRSRLMPMAKLMPVVGGVFQ